MNDIAQSIVVVIVVLLAAGVIFFFVRRNQARNQQELLQLANERGWKVEVIRERLAWGYRLTAPDWTLEAVSRSSGRESGPGSSDVAMQTVWQSPRPGSTLLIGERRSQAELGQVGDMLVRQILSAALGADAAGLVEIEGLSPAFARQYMVWAQHPADLQLPFALQSILLNWQGQKPLIKRTSQGITIEIKGVHLRKPADVSALAQLGEILLDLP